MTKRAHMLACAWGIPGLALVWALLSFEAGAATAYYNLNGYEDMVIPREYGRRQTVATGHDRKYPSREHFAQMMIFIDTDGNQTRLIRTLDSTPTQIVRWRVWTPGSGAVSPCVNGQACLMIDEYVYETTKSDQTISGTDWTRAAQIYKDWVSVQSWYASKGSLKWPNHLSHTLSCSTNSYTYYNTNMRPLLSHLRERAGCFMTQYRADAFDVDYPDYTCAAGANCAAWLQSLKDDNAIGFPYINGALVDVYEDSGDTSPNPEYSADNTCKDSGGNPTVYGATSLRYIDPALSTWPTTLRTAFNALQATDGSNSAGVYLDVLAAVEPQTCYYGGTPSYTAWMAGVKRVFDAFSDVVVMTEAPAEICLPYTDVAYNYIGTDQSYRTPLYGFLYGDIDGLYIVGWKTNGTDTDAQLVAKWNEAVNTFRLDDTLFNSLTDDVNLLTASYENALRLVAKKSPRSELIMAARGRNFPNQTGTDGDVANATIRSTVYGVKIAPSASVTLKNSVIDCRGGGYCIDMGSGATYTGANNVFSYDGNPAPFRINTTEYSTLAQWQAATSQDANSQAADPAFLGGSSPTTADGLRLRANSPLAGAGTDLGDEFADYFGDTFYNGKWDIGAFRRDSCYRRSRDGKLDMARTRSQLVSRCGGMPPRYPEGL